MKFNSNKERKKCWDEMRSLYSEAEIAKAMETFKWDAVSVLRLHYLDGHTLIAIAANIGKSINVVRNRLKAAIYKLQKYFNAQSRQ
jgi:DNA-directed RNA polymerase specialized sigma24 family protein